MRKLAILSSVVFLAFAVGCGGSGGGSSTPVGVSTTVSISPAAGLSLTPGGNVSITATVSTGASNTGVTWGLQGPGTLTNQTSTSVTYVAPSTASSDQDVVVTATAAANSSATAYLPITVTAPGTVLNSTSLVVDSGPAQNATNLAFVSVRVCVPGTTTCGTVDHIQVDTGSEGLRILQSALPASVSLPSLTDSSGNTINNCVSFLDTSYLWGPVQEADVKIAGEVGGAALLQLISSSNSGIPTACTNGGTINENTPTLLGANGILGVGPEPTDCIFAGSDFCDGSVSSTVPPIYFSCPSGGCGTSDSPVMESGVNQVVNPVVLFNTDANGVAINFPPVASTASTLAGTLTFGISTESNNTLGATATIFTMDGCGTFITVFDNQTLVNNTSCNGPGSFIDSGSNALYFPVPSGTTTLPTCPSSTSVGDLSSFYCPTTVQSLSATDQDPNFGTQATVNFSVDNAENLFTNNPTDSVFGTLGGTNTGGGFDWGLPFFFGRTVYTAIDGQVVSTTTGPFWAF